MQSLNFNSPIRNLQVFLRTISRRYPSIPMVVPDGIYGEVTQSAVRAFQKEFSLGETGVADNSTWDHIVRVYKQTELMNADGKPAVIYPEQGLDENHHSYYPTVIIIQSMLYALSEQFENIIEPSVNGKLDSRTRESIKSLQIACGLNPDGNITKNFWNFLTVVYETYISVDRLRGRL